MRYVCFAALVWLLPLGSSRADEPLSGPQVGKEAPGFEALLATGDRAGQKVDYLGGLKDKPVLVVFVSKMTRPGFGLLRKLDRYGQLRQPEGLETALVQVADDAEAAAKYAQLLRDRYSIGAPQMVATSGKAGPPEYGLHDEATMTVLLLDRGHKVLHNTARRAPTDQDFDAIRKAIDDLLGPSPVKFP